MKAIDNLSEEIKKSAKKKGEEISDSEAQKGARDLVSFFELLFDISKKEAKLKHKLKDSPGGFPVDGSYSCSLCRNPIDETNGWYDWFGQTCLICRKAVKDGIIPTFVFNHDNSYFRMWELKSTFGIHYQTAKKYIREKKLFPRVVLNEQGKPYEYIFLRKENPGLIDRNSPSKKSYDRNRAKVSKGLIKEEKVKFKKMHEDHLKEMKKIRDKYRKK